MNFFMHKTKTGLIFSLAEKRSPTKWLFCTPFFIFWPSFANCKLLQRVMYLQVYRNDAPSHLTALNQILFKTDNHGQRYKQFGVQKSKIAL